MSWNFVTDQETYLESEDGKELDKKWEFFFPGMEARGLSHRNPHRLKHINLCKHNCLVLMRCYKILTYYCLTSHRPAHDNFFRMISLNLYFAIYTNLIKSKVFHNHIFINYKNNKKYNIYNFYRTKMKAIQIF